ncbi:MAG TPA: tRNA lysidine(34) synthetase TilS [Steroidobacteraceae bacterium]|nr:tRNA lysidine(34) synthetase TilS [Steroidobacteraceae bacterium]
MAFGAERLADALADIDRGWRDGGACVAVSGGLDSAALLHALAALARAGGFSLRALHVDHGLQRDSAAWARSCRETCGNLGVPLRVLSLGLEPPPGSSVEALARESRYAALAAELRDGERLLTAHHRDDQLETVLIQLLRGSGVAGLAAMPARARLGAGWQLRPLLGVDRAELREYADGHGLGWHEDPMNESLRFDRGWLRARVLPAVLARWPSAASTVSRSAAHLAEASRLLADVAAADADGMLDAGRLSVDGLGRLSRERQVNVLRWWLREQGLRPPPAAKLCEGLAEFLAARPDGAPLLRWDDGEVRRYRGRLYAGSPVPKLPASVPLGEGPALELGAGLGSFGLVESREGGLRAPLSGALELRFRAGGESLRPHPGRPRKRLKDLCQEAGIVPWMRERLPLVFVGGRLAAVGDLWIDSEFAAPPGPPALKPVWSGRPRIY